MQNEKDSFVIYGRQPVVEALKSSYKIQQIWLARDLQGKVIAQIKNLAENKNVDLYFIFLSFAPTSPSMNWQ